MKKRLTKDLILAFPDFILLFEVDYDVSNVGIGVVLSQECQLIAIFSEKLNDAKIKYSIYDRILYYYVSFDTLVSQSPLNGIIFQSWSFVTSKLITKD